MSASEVDNEEVMVHVTKPPSDPEEKRNSSLIAFVNFDSGGKMGKRIALVLQDELGKDNVFNLQDGGPSAGLQKFHGKEDLRVLVAGGDGTVNWILTTIEELKMDPPPAVGIIALGTGNDAARAFGWGHKFPGLYGVRQMTKEMVNCNTTFYDRWEGRIFLQKKKGPKELKQTPASVQEIQEIPTVISDEKKKEPEIVYKFQFNNYFSFGIDAQISNAFHHHRQEYKCCYCCRCCNLSCYGCFGFMSWLCCRSRRLPLSVEIKKSAEDAWETLELPRDVRGLVFLNLPTYAGGRHIWGKVRATDKSSQFTAPSINDGRLEILGVSSTFHLGRMVTDCSSGIRLAQAYEVRVNTTVPSFLQLDGEPWEEAPCRVEIRAIRQARMLERTLEKTSCCQCCKC